MVESEVAAAQLPVLAHHDEQDDDEEERGQYGHDEPDAMLRLTLFPAVHLLVELDHLLVETHVKHVGWQRICLQRVVDLVVSVHAAIVVGLAPHVLIEDGVGLIDALHAVANLVFDIEFLRLRHEGQSLVEVVQESLHLRGLHKCQCAAAAVALRIGHDVDEPAVGLGSLLKLSCYLQFCALVEGDVILVVLRGALRV